MSAYDPATVPELLDDIVRMVETPTGIQAAQERLAQILTRWRPEEIEAHRADLRSLIDRFLPKRRRALNELFEARSSGTPSRGPAPAKPPPAPIRIDPLRFREQLGADLAWLSEHAIFQWSTSYTSLLNELFPDLVEALAPDPALAIAFTLFQQHSREIFSKGYFHNTTRLGVPPDIALAKALNGIGRFLDIPISLLTDTARVDEAHETSARRITATLIAAIISGFAQSSLMSTGAAALAEYPKRWAHALAFLDPLGLARIIDVFSRGDFRTSVENSLVPIMSAIWTFLKEAPGHAVAGEYDPIARRLLIILEIRDENTGQTQLDVQVFMDGAHVTRQNLGLALRSAPAVLAAPLSASIRHVARQSPSIVDLSPGSHDPQQLARMATTLLREARNRELTPPTEESPPKYNFANQFPLEKPTLGPGYLVERESVKSLIDDIRTRHATGISLWTSIRRSGKTTAARELGRHLAGAAVVYQTMHYTEQYTERNVLLSEVESAIKQGEFLSPTFFRSAVAKASEGAGAGGRAIIIIDEYERLFQIIRDEAAVSELMRLRVCSPLLSQITEFANDNLVVLLGMNPLAHYVLMEENQLSAYVRPAHFPLFSHGDGDQDSEFSDLVQKAMTKHVQYTAAFVDALYVETRGHPFLTVKALRDMLDWMLSEQRAVPRSGFDEAVVDAYVDALDKRRLRQSEHFDFFRMFVRETLQKANPVDQGWLSASMKVLQSCAENTGKLSYLDAVAVVKQCSTGLQPDEVLELATRTNLLVLDAETVQPAIPLLAKIVGSEARRT